MATLVPNHCTVLLLRFNGLMTGFWEFLDSRDRPLTYKESRVLIRFMFIVRTRCKENYTQLLINTVFRYPSVIHMDIIAITGILVAYGRTNRLDASF